MNFKSSACVALTLSFIAFLSGCSQTAAKPDVATAQGDSPALAMEDRVSFFVDHARNGNCDEVAKEIKAGIPINQRDGLDQTALIAAVSHGSIVCVRLLLDHGADPGITDNAGWTPLIFAAYFSATDEMLNLLIDHGSKINAQNDRGVTALYLASATGHEPQVKLLLARGADPNVVSKSGYTPLRIAQIKSLEPIVALLKPVTSASAAGIAPTSESADDAKVTR